MCDVPLFCCPGFNMWLVMSNASEIRETVFTPSLENGKRV